MIIGKLGEKMKNRANKINNTNYVDHRLIKMIDEIICFFYSLKATNIKMDMDITSEYAILRFDGVINEVIEQKRLDKINKLLSSPRQHEMEAYYWSLSGNDVTPSTELALVGMMTDDYEIQYSPEDSHFSIMLKRLN